MGLLIKNMWEIGLRITRGLLKNVVHCAISSCKYNVNGSSLFAGDHALIDITQLLSLNPRQVTVRTKSRDNQSTDSTPVLIPGAKNKAPHHHHHHHHKVNNLLLDRRNIQFAYDHNGATVIGIISNIRVSIVFFKGPYYGVVF